MRTNRTEWFLSVVALSCAMTGCGAEAPDASAQAGQENALASPALGENEMSLEEQAERQHFAEEVVGAEMAEKALRDTSDQGSLYTLELADGRVIEWLEPNYGKLLITESGIEEGGAMAELRNSNPKTASAAFSAFQPGAAVPDVLQALDARIAEMTPVYQALRSARREQDPTAWNGVAPEAAESPFAQNGHALTKEVFSDSSSEAGFVSLCNGLYTHVQFGSPGNKIKYQDINDGVGLGFGKKGKITVQVKVRQWWGWEQVYRDDTNQGTWRGVYMSDVVVDFDMETAVYTDAGEKAISCMARP